MHSFVERHPYGCHWRCCCDEQEEAPCLKRGGGLHPARPGCWPPTKRRRAAPGGLMATHDVLLTLGGCAPVLAHMPSFGRNPGGSPDFLAYPVPKACQRRVLGTWVPRYSGVARSASSPKAALALGCSLTPGRRVTFSRVTCMTRAASVSGVWTLGFLLSCGARPWFCGSSSPNISWFGFLVWYVFGLWFPPAFLRPWPRLAVCAGGCGFRLLRASSGWGLVRVCLGAGCRVGFWVWGLRFVPGCGLGRSSTFLCWVRWWCVWVGVSFIPRRSCPGCVVRGPGWVSLDARLSADVSLAGL